MDSKIDHPRSHVKAVVVPTLREERRMSSRTRAGRRKGELTRGGSAAAGSVAVGTSQGFHVSGNPAAGAVL